MKVKLLTSASSIAEMERNAAVAALTCRGNADKEHVASEVLGRIIKAGHESVLEHITLTYSVKGISRALLQELARYRHISLSVESTRHTLRNRVKINENEAECESWSVLEEYCKGNRDMRDFAADFFEFSRQNSALPNDELKYYLPEFWPTNLVLTSNIRELRHILRLRTSSAALKEFRELAYMMYEVVPEEYRYLLKDCLYENRTGKWQLYEDKDTNAWECSKCGGVWQLNEGSPKEHKMKYCPYCGTEMRGEAN